MPLQCFIVGLSLELESCGLHSTKGKLENRIQFMTEMGSEDEILPSSFSPSWYPSATLPVPILFHT